MLVKMQTKSPKNIVTNSTVAKYLFKDKNKEMWLKSIAIVFHTMDFIGSCRINSEVKLPCFLPINHILKQGKFAWCRT